MFGLIIVIIPSYPVAAAKSLQNAEQFCTKVAPSSGLQISWIFHFGFPGFDQQFEVV